MSGRGVISVHGGGFTQATRNGPAEQAWGAALAGRGFVLVAIDYRLGSGEPFGLDQATDPAASLSSPTLSPMPPQP